MGLDIGGWFKRIITLPKAKNSLADVLGEDLAALFKQLAAPLVESVLDEALEFAGAGLGGTFLIANRVAALFVREVEKRLGRGVSQWLEYEIEEALSAALDRVNALDRDSVREALRQGLYRALKL